MIPRGDKFVREIEETLREEIDLQLRYATAMEEESKALRKFDALSVAERTTHREMLLERMKAAQQRREELTNRFPEGAGQRLSTLIRMHCHPEDAKRLKNVADRLRILVQGNKTRGLEFGSIVSFALNLVSGSLSLIWSATQSVTTSYGRNKTIRETLTPKTKGHTTIEEA